jgi:hypothetical protein
VKKHKKAHLSKSSVTKSLPIFDGSFAPVSAVFIATNNSVSISFANCFNRFL